MELSEKTVEALLGVVLQEFHGRHQKPLQFFKERFEDVKRHLLTDRRLSEKRQLLIGAYFTQEYALESSALFNPSMVWHPQQNGLPNGSKRFILSLRATGEGHLSSTTFRSGVIDEHGKISLDKPTGFVTLPTTVPNATYEKTLFHRKLFELGLANEFTSHVLTALAESFNLGELESALQFGLHEHRTRHQELEPIARGILALAKANYEIEYGADLDLSERVVFPFSPTETNGIEDARFVQFHEDDGRSRYIATYTAFDGKFVFPQILETEDFVRFKISTLNGPEARNKGMALFPRTINGHYAMLSRQDGENIFLMYSDMLHFWYTKELVVKPTYPWEFVQVGNCGPPLETAAGWLVLTHGVGPMRKYAIGAILLDLEDPTKVIGRLPNPLVAVNTKEREGYVPNVVYSCGAQIHNDQLILPYAMSDYATTFATVRVPDLLEAMKPD